MYYHSEPRVHIHSTIWHPPVGFDLIVFFLQDKLLRVTMIDCRQLYFALLPYEGTALNLIDIKSAVLDLRRKSYIGSIHLKKVGQG